MMTDLVYFGYVWDDDSYSNQVEFMKEVETKFANVEFSEAYDSIKGYRKEVILKDEQKDDYYAWIMAHGWHWSSLTVSLMLMDKGQKEEAERLIDLAKETYPENFKSEG
jgi:aspartokinase